MALSAPNGSEILKYSSILSKLVDQGRIDPHSPQPFDRAVAYLMANLQIDRTSQASAQDVLWHAQVEESHLPQSIPGDMTVREFECAAVLFLGAHGLGCVRNATSGDLVRLKGVRYVPNPTLNLCF